MRKRLLLISFSGLLILVLAIGLRPSTTSARQGETPWAPWENKDLSTLGDDNSGSKVAMSEDVLTPGGQPSLQVMPSGTSGETKVAVPVSGADLQDWTTYGQLELEVYLPPENALNANKFFLGEGDVTGEWAWVGGIFSETAVQTGWNRLVYVLDPAMRQPKADGQYMLYLSFFSEDENKNKVNLTEAFYLGGAYLSGAGEAAAAGGETAAAEPVAETVLWKVWEGKNPGMFGDDNTGTNFAQSADILTPSGANSLEIIPGGTIDETKFAFPVSGANLQDWATHSQFELEIYLPPENSVNPNSFFLGMADITGEWAWVGGVWGILQGDSGWTRIVFPLDPMMQQPNPNGAYMVYLASINLDENKNKTVLTEPFYLGSGYLTNAPEATPVPTAVVWPVWESKDLAVLGDDNSGSTFALSNEVLTADGKPSLQIMPGGTSAETKLAFPISAAELQDWSGFTKVELDVYLPAENAMNPNKFFMGMGDVTGEWSWVGGIFGGTTTTTLEAGWNRVVYTPLDPMRQPKADGKYMLYLSFFYEDATGKPPLTEPFYLGSMYLSEPVVVTAPGEYSQDAVYQSEVDLLLSFDDVALLDAVAHETFDFFWYEANPANGLIKDRSTADSPASIASVGFGLAALPIGVDRGWITYDQGYERALTTLQTFANGGVQGEHGFFYHFVDMQTGERVWSSEVSSIDSTLFIAGALTAAQYFQETEVAALAEQLYEQMDWQWMLSNGDMVSMGWKPDIGFLSAFWDHFDESLLIYPLAIGSPTHLISASSWAEWKRPVDPQGEFIYLTGDPLFVYQYPLAYLNLRNHEDAYANYFNNTVRACERHEKFAADHAATFKTYQNGVWGISASDGPRGYQAYGTGNQDGTIAPYASIACLPFTPDAAFSSMRAMLQQYGTKVWREYGFVSAINADVDWYSVDHIGIDEGDILLMITNAQDGFVWNLFMQNENIQKALVDMGFVEQESDYAVTPAYLEKVKAG